MTVSASTSARSASTVTPADGFRLWPGALDREVQVALLGDVLRALEKAPLYRPTTRAGRPFSVRMSNMGPLGWVSDRGGYRYQAQHPVTGRPWPPIPQFLLGLWTSLTEHERSPDACLINVYDADARMGLHQDRDEADLTSPVLSISLGDTAVFRLGAAAGGPTHSFRLTSGDVCMLAGASRLARHGVDRILGGSSSLVPQGGRINLTLRRAAD